MRYRQNTEFASIQEPQEQTENPYRNIVFYPALEKYGVTVAKRPYVTVASLHDTLAEAIAARNDLRKSLEAKREERAVRFAQDPSPLTPDSAGYFDSFDEESLS